mgnify:CR=1 FL=1
MTTLINFLKEHEKTCLGLSIAALTGYLLFRKEHQKVVEQPKKNNLHTSLKELIERVKHSNIRKIVITADPDTQGNFRRNLVSEIKSRLIEANIKVLINCSV